MKHEKPVSEKMWIAEVDRYRETGLSIRAYLIGLVDRFQSKEVVKDWWAERKNALIASWIRRGIYATPKECRADRTYKTMSHFMSNILWAWSAKIQDLGLTTEAWLALSDNAQAEYRKALREEKPKVEVIACADIRSDQYLENQGASEISLKMQLQECEALVHSLACALADNKQNAHPEDDALREYAGKVHSLTAHDLTVALDPISLKIAA